MTGSPCDAFSDEPWVVHLRQLLAAAVRRGQRVLGMCFGCQVVAVALQGSAGEVLKTLSNTLVGFTPQAPLPHSTSPGTWESRCAL